jgi:calmodulin
MVDKLTNEEITEFKAAFDYFDRDRDGKIDINELCGFMRNFGQNPNEDDLRGMLKDVDLDEDGVINFNEFVCLLIKDLKGVDIWKEELYEVFKYIGVPVEEIGYNQPKGVRYPTENPWA